MFICEKYAFAVDEGTLIKFYIQKAKYLADGNR